jgi:hypothetical protein
VRVQLPAVAVFLGLVLVIVAPALLRGTAADVESAHFALPRGALALPAGLMFCALFAESAAMNWSAVFLNGPAGAGSAVAAGAVVDYAAAMGVARLFGDRLMLRWGIGGLARRSGLLTCAGTLLAITTLAGPVAGRVRAHRRRLRGDRAGALPRGGSAPGIAQGAGIAAVATAGYSGGLLNGPAIGFLARGVGLSAALGLLVAAGATIVLFGPRLGSST